MDRNSSFVKLATLVFCFGLMGLFVAYESGYIGDRRKPNLSSADDGAVFKQGEMGKFPVRTDATKTRVTHTMFTAPTEMMSSSKTSVISHSFSQWMFGNPSATVYGGVFFSNTIASNR